jgi:hypothetical protein
MHLYSQIFYMSRSIFYENCISDHFLPNVSWLYPWVMYHICPHSPHYNIFYDLVFNAILTFENIIHTHIFS